jgi:ABC-type polysaccharide/polyol phosphate export permease
MIVLDLVAIELKEYFRNPIAAFWTFAYPVLLLVLLMVPFGSTTVVSASGLKVGYGPYLVCGMLAINVLSTSLFGFTVPFVEARQRGAFKMYQVFPVWRFSYVAAFVASRVAIVVFYNAAFVFIATALYRIDFGMRLPSWGTLALVMLLTAAAFVALSFLLASLCNRPATAVAITNILFFPMMFFSDLFLPMMFFPASVRWLAHASPVGIVANAFRSIMIDHAGIGAQGLAFAVLGTLCAAAVVLSVFAFRWRSD